MGTLFFAFTVFYAYVTFAQYFIIWNANMPEKLSGTCCARREHVVGEHGHHLRPFLCAVLSLLRIDIKSSPCFVIPLAIWHG